MKKGHNEHKEDETTSMGDDGPFLETVTVPLPCPDLIESWISEDEQEFQVRHNKKLVKKLLAEQRSELVVRLLATGFLMVGIAELVFALYILMTVKISS